jgi:hypothetical protein
MLGGYLDSLKIMSLLDPRGRFGFGTKLRLKGAAVTIPRKGNLDLGSGSKLRFWWRIRWGNCRCPGRSHHSRHSGSSDLSVVVPEGWRVD